MRGAECSRGRDGRGHISKEEQAEVSSGETANKEANKQRNPNPDPRSSSKILVD